MIHDRQAHARRFVAGRSATTRQVLRIGSWKIPVAVLAWGLSAIVHGGLLTASYFVIWNPTPASDPKIRFAKGDQAARIQVFLVPLLEPAEEEKAAEENRSEKPDAESSALAASAEEVAVVDQSEDVEPDHLLGPVVTTSEDVDFPAENESEATELAEGRVLEDDRALPPAEDAVEATRHLQRVAEILEYLFDQLQRMVPPPETSEQVDREQPLAIETVDPAPPNMSGVEDRTSGRDQPTEESVHSTSSASQTVGVETGVETLDLPTPKYPSLSRRRGEEGLVLLQVEIRSDGSVGAITVLRDAGFGRLTEAAISAARKGRFKPATRDGHPIQATVRIPFRFVLR